MASDEIYTLAKSVDIANVLNVNLKNSIAKLLDDVNIWFVSVEKLQIKIIRMQNNVKSLSSKSFADTARHNEAV